MARRSYNHNNPNSPCFEYRTYFGTITVSRGIMDQINNFSVYTNTVTYEDIRASLNQML